MQSAKMKLLPAVLSLVFGSNALADTVNMSQQEQVKQVITRMINAVDSKQWQQAKQQFTKDMFADYSSLSGQPGAQTASAELVDSWQELLGQVSTHHLLSNFEISLDGKQAEAFSHVYASHTAEGVDSYWDVFGRYHHKLQKQSDGWKINSITR